MRGHVLENNVESSWQRHPALSLAFFFSDLWNLSFLDACILCVGSHSSHVTSFVVFKSRIWVWLWETLVKEDVSTLYSQFCFKMKPFSDVCVVWVVGRKNSLRTGRTSVVYVSYIVSLNCLKNTTTTKRNTGCFNLGNRKMWRSFFLSTWRDPQVSVMAPTDSTWVVGWVRKCPEGGGGKQDQHVIEGNKFHHTLRTWKKVFWSW